MKLKLLTIALFTYAAVANASPSKPDKCPGVAAIQAVGVNSEYLEDNGHGMWMAGAINQPYDTNMTWNFIVANIAAATKHDAYLKAVDSLSSLALLGGPTESPFGGWSCVYSTNAGYEVRAFSQ